MRFFQQPPPIINPLPTVDGPAWLTNVTQSSNVWNPEATFGTAQIIYFDAQSSTYSGGTWQNLGADGAAMNAVQGTGANQPTLTAGSTPSGKSAMVFDGTNDSLVTGVRGVALAQPYTICVVCYSGSTTFYVAAGSATNHSDILVNSATQFGGNAGGSNALSPSITVQNTWHALLFEVNGASSALYADNVAGATINAGANTYNVTSFATFPASGFFWPGRIAEYRVINRLLTSAEKTNLYAYQRTQWGI
jgi:hypothetical protein